LDAGPGLTFAEAEVASAAEEFVIDEGSVELGAGEEHPQAEGGPVEPVVSVPDGRSAQLGDFRSQGGQSVPGPARLATRLGTVTAREVTPGRASQPYGAGVTGTVGSIQV
jgi:hypothetical protein